MLKILGWFIGIIISLSAIALAGAWMLLQSSLFTDYRRNAIQTALSEQIGQPLIIRDDVRMQIRRNSTVFIGGVEIPSENIEGVNLAQLDAASFKLDLIGLIRGKFQIDQLEISKLHVNVMTEDDRTTSWTKRDIWAGAGGEDSLGQSDKEATSSEKSVEMDTVQSSSESGELNESVDTDIAAIAEAPQTSFFQFLSNKTANFDDIRLTIDNKWTGFQFSFVLDSLALDQLEGGKLVSLSSDGTVNERKFQVRGQFPKGKQFETSAIFGGTELQIVGTPFPEEMGDGYNADLELDTGSIGDLLEAVGLQKVLDGTGDVAAKITAKPQGVKVSNIEAKADFAEGQSISVTGEIENVLELVGVNINIDTLLQPADEPVVRAESLRDLRLVDLDAQIVSTEGGLELENLRLKTNAFQQDLRKIGPVSIARIHRTQEGELSLSGVDIQVGPKGKPVVNAMGDIRDILAFKGIEFSGKLEAGADLILKSLEPARVAEFGSVKGEFTISDASGELAVTQFDGNSFGSELWSLNSNMSVRDVTKLADLKFSFNLGVADGARFLEALNLEPVDTGKLSFSAQIAGQSLDMAITAATTINQSRLDASLNNETTDEHQVVRGEMKSAEIHIDDLRDVVRAAVQLQSLFSAGNTKKTDVEVQPLVIEVDEQPEPEEVADETEVLPLVIEEEVPEDDELFTGRNLLRRLDLEFGIDIEKIVGQEGISGLNSDLSVKAGKLEFGPLDATYGGGHFDITGEMDLLNNSDNLQIAGSTGGWDIGEILDSVGLGIDAYGNLTGDFNVNGDISSIKSFLNTAEGNATIRMANGRVATSLVELAGLGIVKWLFSEELRQGYTNIVCINAPVRLNNGRASSNAIVAETESVQLVVEGSANWREDSISVRAEPRPVGRPLSRSALPFEVHGKLSKPEFKLKVAGVPGAPQGLFAAVSESTNKRVPCVPDDRQ